MNPTFWSHTIWYLLLGAATILEWIIIFRHTQDRKRTFAYYLTVSGMTFSFEMVVLSYFKAYQYMPMLIPNMPSDDSIAGNLFSQFSVSATALLLAVLRLKYYWYLVFAAAYGVIEELFLTLGIYRHHWYRTWMTVLALLLLFWCTVKAYEVWKKPIWRWLRYVFIYFGLVTLHEHTIVWALRIGGVRTFSETLLPDKEQSMVVLTGIHMLLLGTIAIAMYFSKMNWWGKLAVIAALYLAHYVAMKFGLIRCKEGWFWFSSSVSIWGMYFYTYLLDRLYAPPRSAPT